MCGIVGAIGTTQAATIVLDGLAKLEYRGYDSAGVAVNTDALHIRKAAGKLTNLHAEIEANPLPAATLAIGHTRWATHGEPNAANAHPHVSGRCAVVHNGIIENYQTLRSELTEAGVTFASETDTEALAAQMDQHLAAGHTPLEAVQATIQAAEGAFALGILIANETNTLIGTRRGAPLCVGLGEDANYLASDPAALAGLTKNFIFLEEDDIAVLTPTDVTIYKPNGNVVQRNKTVIDLTSAMAGKAGYPHYMLKEIHEQPAVVSHLLDAYLDAQTGATTLPKLPCDLTQVPAITIVACGTAYYAGMVGKYLLEQWAGIPVNIDIASEFRYRTPPLADGGLFIAVSQSGETADTLAALEYAKKHGQYTLALTNTPTSSIARASDTVMDLMAGQEIAVASTKAFMAMTTAFALLALEGAAQGNRNTQAMAQALRELPAKLTQMLSRTEGYRDLALTLQESHSMLYLGRGTLQALAFEGALKMKEITYIHAEGYASGEMKHGPIALVDEHMPVVNLAASNDPVFDKTLSNMKEVEARRGRVILITDKDGVAKLDKTLKEKTTLITIPRSHAFTLPMMFTIPLQLLAYETAIAKGTDVDQPRNLAKSVTVE